MNKPLVLMSGTLHSESVLKTIFGVDNYALVEAETFPQGSIEVMRTGEEFDCRYSNFQENLFSRGDYLNAFSTILDKLEKPALIHVVAFYDLPSEEEKTKNPRARSAKMKIIEKI